MMHLKMKPSLEIRPLKVADLLFADGLRATAGWNQSVLDWKRIMALNPSGCFVATWGNEPVGTVTTVCHGENLGWIGMALVEEAHRRRGVAPELLKHAVKHLKAQGATCIKLDAESRGQQVYKKLNFKPEWPLHRWEWRADEDVIDHRVPRDIFLRELDPKDLEKILQLDREIFGADRGQLLQAMLADAFRSTVWDLYSDIESYGMIRPGADADYLGPVVSTSEHHAHILIRDLISRSKQKMIYWDIPDANKEAQKIAKDLGFEPVQSLMRMRLGRDVGKGIPESQYAISDPATG